MLRTVDVEQKEVESSRERVKDWTSSQKNKEHSEIMAVYSIASKRTGKKRKLPSEWHICTFWKNCSAPRQSLVEFSWSIKVITLTQCSLQTDRNKLSRPHWRRTFPQSSVKTALDAENFFVPIIEKNRAQMWALKGTETGTVKVSCLSASLTCTADGDHMKQDWETGEQEMMRHLTPGKMKRRILEDLCIHHLFMTLCLLKTTHNMEITAWLSGVLGFTPRN